MWLTEPRNLKRLRSVWGHVQGVLIAIFLYLILEQLFLTYARQKLFYKRLNLHYFLLFETYLKICHFFHFFLYSFCLHDFSVQFLLNFYYSQTHTEPSYRFKMELFAKKAVPILAKNSISDT